MLDATINNEQKNQLSRDDFENVENTVCYALTENTIEIMALSGIEDCQNYIIIFDENDYDKLDVVYNPGIKYENEIIYSLSYMKLKMGE